MKIIMFNIVSYNKRHPSLHIPLNKNKSDYKTIEKEMQEAPKDYDTIKMLIETENNNITKIQNKNVNKNPLEMNVKKKIILNIKNIFF